MANFNGWTRVFILIYVAFVGPLVGQAQATTVELRCQGIQTDLNPFTYRGVASSKVRISFGVSIGDNYLIIKNGGNSVSLPITSLTDNAVVSNAITEELSHPLAKNITRFQWLANISRTDGYIRIFKSLEGTNNVWLSVEGRCQSKRLF